MSFVSIHPMQWSTAQCVEWLQSLNIKNADCYITALISVINDNDYDGESLVDVLSSSENLKNEIKDETNFTIKVGVCNNICKGFTAALKASNNGGNVYDDLLDFSSEGQPGNDKFTVWVYGVPHKGNSRVVISDMTSSSTIKDLRKILAGLEALDVTQFTIMGHDDNSTLGKCDIKHQSSVHFLAKSHGGTSVAHFNGKRSIKWEDCSVLKKTRKADCIYGYTAKEGFSVCEMSCGHAMEAGSMLKYIQTVFGNNLGAIKMRCPLPKCKTLWPFDVCCRAAGMNDAEFRDWGSKKAARANFDLRLCPHCGAFSERNKTVVILRMRCGVCSKNRSDQDWCWVCSQHWKGSSLIICNNANCSYVQNINRQLAAAKMEVPFGWEKLSVPVEQKSLPKVRACPFCLTFTEKSRGCKHMTCKGCKKSFCFSCLKSGDVCTHGKYNVICDIHPKQKFE